MENGVEIIWLGNSSREIRQTASTLAEIYVREGKFAQIFNDLWINKQDYPLLTCCRIWDKPVRLHSALKNIDLVVLMDPELIKHPCDVKQRTRDSTIFLVNSAKSGQDLKNELKIKDRPLYLVNSDQIMMDELGVTIPPLPVFFRLNQILNIVKNDQLKRAINTHFSLSLSREKMDQLFNRLQEEVGPV